MVKCFPTPSFGVVIKYRLAYTALCILLSVTLPGCASSGGGISAASADQLAPGKRVYDAWCAGCHGAQGQGQYPDAVYTPDKKGLIAAPPHDSTGHTWHHADGELTSIVRNGLIVQGFEPMPAFGDHLTDAEIQAVLRYIKSWWKPEQLQFQATVSAQYTPPTR